MYNLSDKQGLRLSAELEINNILEIASNYSISWHKKPFNRGYSCRHSQLPRKSKTILNLSSDRYPKATCKLVNTQIIYLPRLLLTLPVPFSPWNLAKLQIQLPSRHENTHGHLLIFSSAHRGGLLPSYN